MKGFLSLISVASVVVLVSIIIAWVVPMDNAYLYVMHKTCRGKEPYPDPCPSWADKSILGRVKYLMCEYATVLQCLLVEWIWMLKVLGVYFGRL